LDPTLASDLEDVLFKGSQRFARRCQELTIGDNGVCPADPLPPEAEDNAAVLVLVLGHGKECGEMNG